MGNLVNKKRILVCPLDWGLGHASRCIPIISELLFQKHEVIIGADGGPLALLQKEFPDVEKIIFPSFTEIKYSAGKSQVKKMLGLIPSILSSIKLEHSFLKNVINEKNIDVVISDNRYGVWNKNVKSIIISHQLSLQLPQKLNFFKSVSDRIISKKINCFNELWIPDFDDENNLSGNLSENKFIQISKKYVGLLSKFSCKEKIEFNKFPEFDLVIVLSGPEPQRQIFENILTQQAQTLNVKTLVVQGIPNASGMMVENGNVVSIASLGKTELEQVLVHAKNIVCRAGYSSIMDLICLEKNALLVPTPGQTEQEYLAKRMLELNLFYSVQQHEINLQQDLKKIKRADFTKYKRNDNSLKKY